MLSPLSWRSLCLICIIMASTQAQSTFKVGMARDRLLRYVGVDTFIFNGMEYWAKWVNDTGGMYFGSEKMFVEVVVVDGYEADPNLVFKTINDAYVKLVQQKGINVAIAPYTGLRAKASANATDPLGVINFATTPSSDIYNSVSTKDTFAWALPIQKIPPLFAGMLPQAKSFVLLSATTNVPYLVAKYSEAYFASIGWENKGSIYANPSTAENSGLDAILRELIFNLTDGKQIDVFVCSLSPDQAGSTLAAFAEVQPNVKAAIHLMPNSIDVFQKPSSSTGNKSPGQGWMAYTSFDINFGQGQSGVLGGTSEEFVRDFRSIYNTEPDYTTAQVVTSLMSFYVAANKTRSNDTNVIRQSMLDEPLLDLFTGPLGWFSDNETVSIYTVYPYQIDGLVANPLSGDKSASVIYPAIFPWTQIRSVATRSQALSIALGVIVGVCMLGTLISLVLIIIRNRAFSKQGIFYCVVVSVGILMAYAAAIMPLPVPTEALCLAFPWLLGVGFTLVYGCLFIKTWAIFKIFRSAQKLKHIILSPYYIVRALAVCLLVEVAFLIVWSAIDAPTPRLVRIVNDQSQLMCDGNHSTVFWAVFVAYKMLWLLAGAVLSFLTRHIRTDHNESKGIALIVYNCSGIGIITIILGFLLRSIPTAQTAVQVLAIVLIFTFTLVTLFMKPWGKISKNQLSDTSGSSDAGTSASSKNSMSVRGSPASTRTTDSSGSSPPV